MRIYHTRSVLFNFLNGTRMRIVLNKRDGVGMGATGPEPALLPSLGAIGAGFIIFVFQVLFKVMLFFKFQFKEWRNRDGMAQTWGSNGDNISWSLKGIGFVFINYPLFYFKIFGLNSKFQTTDFWTVLSLLISLLFML